MKVVMDTIAEFSCVADVAGPAVITMFPCVVHLAVDICTWLTGGCAAKPSLIALQMVTDGGLATF